VAYFEALYRDSPREAGKATTSGRFEGSFRIALWVLLSPSLHVDLYCKICLPTQSPIQWVKGTLSLRG